MTTEVQPTKSFLSVGPDEGYTLDDVEFLYGSMILAKFNGNRTHAAKYLGISIRTMQRKARQWAKRTWPDLDECLVTYTVESPL